MKIDYYLGLSEEGFHRILYSEWGTPNPLKTPIICVHGLTRNRLDFDKLAAYLSERNFHLFCPDMVGRGDSDWMKNPIHYTYEQYINDCQGMINYSQAKSVDWIGTSMGGIIGMVLASLPHSPIKRLILNDVGPQIALKGLTRLLTYTHQYPIFASIEEAKAYFQKVLNTMGPLSDADWEQITKNSVRETESKHFQLKIDPKINSTSIKSKIAWNSILHPHKTLEGVFFDVDLWYIWKTVQCPTLVIHGKDSDILLPSTIKKMQQTHPHVDVVEIDATGHAPALWHQPQHEMIYQWLESTKIS